MTERIDDFDDDRASAGGAERPPPASEPGAETLRVLGAVQDWANRVFPEAAEQHASGTCQWCPICQFVAVLRGDRPEVTERVVEAGTALMSAFRAFVDASGTPAPEQRPPPGPRVQRIDLAREGRPRPKPYPDAGA